MSDKEKSRTIENFIGVYDNYFTDSMVDQFLEIYKDHEHRKKVFDRAFYHSISPALVKDTMVQLEFKETQTWLQKVPAFSENFMMILKDYLKEVPIDKYVDYTDLNFMPIKIQKTSPGEGYHAWHVESSTSMSMIKRVLVYSIYLNDIEDGGETEFLYQHMRVKPKKGRAVIWPAYFPFVHRGNPPLKEDKYIITSWLAGEFKIG